MSTSTPVTKSIDQSATPLRTWRPMALWTAGILLALGLAWFVGAVAVSAHRAHLVVKNFRSRCSGGQGATDTKANAAIMQLGGAEAASRRLAIYLRLPRRAYDDELRYYAIRLAVSCGKPAMNILGNELASSQPMERALAAEGLARIGPEAVAFAPALKKALLDPEADVRIAAGYSLARIDSGNAHGIQTLVDVLSSGNAFARSSAAWHLNWLGPDAKASIPALENAAGAGDEDLRYAAAEALKNIRGGNEGK